MECTQCLSSGCHNKEPQTGRFKQQTLISLSGGWKSELSVLAWLNAGDILFLACRWPRLPTAGVFLAVLSIGCGTWAL